MRTITFAPIDFGPVDANGVQIISNIPEGSPYNLQFSLVGGTIACCGYAIQRRNLDSTNPADWAAFIDDRIVISAGSDSFGYTATVTITAVSSDTTYQYRIAATDGATSYSDAFSLEVTTFGVIGKALQLMKGPVGFVAYWTPARVGPNNLVGVYDYPSYTRKLFTTAVASGGSYIKLYLTYSNPGVSTAIVAQDKLGHNSFWYVYDQFVEGSFTGVLFPSASVDSFRNAMISWLAPLLKAAGNSAHDYKVEIARMGTANSAAARTFLFYARDYHTGQLASSTVTLAALTAGGVSVGSAFTVPGYGQVATNTVSLTALTYSVIRSASTTNSLNGGSSYLGFMASGVVGRSATGYTTAQPQLWMANLNFVQAEPATSDQLIFEAVTDVVVSENVATPFRSRQPYRLRSNTGLYLVVNNDYTTTNGFATLSTTSTASAATAFVIGDNTDARYFLTDAAQDVVGTDDGNLNVWAAPPCVELAVANCRNVEDAPQYRRLELDLGGTFSVDKISMWFDFYSVSKPQTTTPFVSNSWPSTSRFPSNITSATGQNIELWLKSETGDYVDFSAALDGAALTNCVNRRTPIAGLTCQLTFTIAAYGQASLGLVGNVGYRHVRIVLDGLPTTSESQIFYRTHAIRDIQVAGGCNCNGHSYNCDLLTGDCSPAGTAGCQHDTAGVSCDTCAPGFFVNYGNKPITVPPNTEYTCTSDVSTVVGSSGNSFQVTNCDGPSLPDLGYVGLAEIPDRSEAFDVYFYDGGPCVGCDCYLHDNYTYGVPGDRGCEQVTGECHCHPSTLTEGHNCELCEDGACRTSTDLYQTCELCVCNQHAVDTTSTGADSCAKDTCGCNCKPEDHVTGLHCEDCETGYWSVSGSGLLGDVCFACECNGHKPSGDGVTEVCDVTGGNCDMSGDPCNGFTTGEHCEKCLPGYYRPYISGTLDVDLTDDCIPCACANLADPLTWGDGTTAICDPNGGVCNCRSSANVVGDHCEECIDGFFSPNSGPGYTDTVGCSACLCNDHKGVTNYCNRQGGECNEGPTGAPDPCQGNTEGSSCELCKATFFRPYVSGTSVDLTDDCQSCDCNGHSIAPIAGVDTCNAEGGYCTCDGVSNSEGNHCEFCIENFWNEFGNSEDGRICAPCACHGHSTTCSNFGVCSSCSGNTENGAGDSCDECVSGYRRNTQINPADAGNPTVIEDARFDTCTLCTCNGHSTTCDSYTGSCTNCDGNTENDAWPNAYCNRCDPTFYRQITGFVPTDDVCNVCGLTGGSCDVHTLADDCLSCADQCFGPNKECVETTGECTNCAASNAIGRRCERCAPGFYGDPTQGIPCVACKGACYHTVPQIWTDTTLLGPILSCETANYPEVRQCVLDYPLSGDVISAAIPQSDAVMCNCPEAPAGLHATLDTIPPYLNRDCSACNPSGFFGQPTVCLTPGLGGSALGDCDAFHTCIECGCNGNINEALAANNCAYDDAKPSDLSCSNCEGRTTGDSCEMCESGSYGSATRTDVSGVYPGFPVDLSGNNLKCFQCDCNGRSLAASTVDILSDTCTTTSPTTYSCECKEPYTGATCRECKRGYSPIYDTTDGIDSAPGYVWCKPCPDCILALYSGGIVPLEDDGALLNANFNSLNTSVANLWIEVNNINAALPYRVAALPTLRRDADSEAAVANLMEEAKAALQESIAANQNKLADAESKLNELTANVNVAIASINDKLSQADIDTKLTPAAVQAAELSAQLATASDKVAALQRNMRDYEARSTASIIEHLTRLVAAEKAAETAAADVVEFKAATLARLDALSPLSASLATQVASVADSFTALSASIHAAMEDKSRIVDDKITAVAALSTLVGDSLASVNAFQADAEALNARFDSVSATVQSLVEASSALRANVNARLAASREEIVAATERIAAAQADVTAQIAVAKSQLGDGIETMSAQFAARLTTLRQSFEDAVAAEKSAHASTATEIKSFVSSTTEEARAQLADHSTKLDDFERQLKGIQVAMDENVDELATKLSATVARLSNVVSSAAAGQFVLPDEFHGFINRASYEMSTLQRTIKSRASQMEGYLGSNLLALTAKLNQIRAQAEVDNESVRQNAQVRMDAALAELRNVISQIRTEQSSAIAAAEARLAAAVATAEQSVRDGVAAARREVAADAAAVKTWTEDRIAHIQAEVDAKSAQISESAKTAADRAKQVATSTISTASQEIARQRELVLAPLRTELASTLKSVAEVSASLSSLDQASKRMANKVQTVEADTALARAQLKNLQNNLKAFLSIPSSINIAEDFSKTVSPFTGDASFVAKHLHPGCRNGSNQPCPADQADAAVAAAAPAGASSSSSSSSSSDNNGLVLKVALPATAFVAFVALVVAGVFYRKYRAASANNGYHRVSTHI
ncbi:hypothetical protein CAOG_003066 [Capsaspora owczarzaki ATCC 30864]|uniref:Laminin EGF-like domain-containing protein n=1 Tax=Capsaspora owczarzaki (strain ATCC 30864) TaxID=595528 RepID=A0A0D2VNT5_CAPO3|nr:hypothetical protein CAOG_003066 [Capsaspora owczarzaki ATCC 30864]